MSLMQIVQESTPPTKVEQLSFHPIIAFIKKKKSAGKGRKGLCPMVPEPTQPETDRMI